MRLSLEVRYERPGETKPAVACMRPHFQIADTGTSAPRLVYKSTDGLTKGGSL
jgi:hypothetical protein